MGNSASRGKDRPKTHSTHPHTASFLVLQRVGISAQDYPAFYEAVIQNPDYADKLFLGFQALQKSGIFFQQHPELYKGVIRKSYCADRLQLVFDTMEQVGISFQNYPTLYDVAIRGVPFSDKLSIGILALKKANISVEAYPNLYKAFIHEPFYAKDLAAAFAVLQEASINVEAYPSLYELVMQRAFHVDRLAAGFKLLQQADMSFQNHPTLYEALIRNALVAEKLAVLFVALKQAGINFQDHPKLYEAVIQSYRNEDKLPAAFVALKRIGLGTEVNHIRLCIFLAEQILIRNIDIEGLLEKIELLNLRAPEDFDMIDQVLRAGQAALEILTWLQENKFNKDQYQRIYEACFLGNTPLIRSPYTFSKVKQQIEGYFKKNPPLTSDNIAYAAQCQEVQQIMDIVLCSEKDITEGPLNKTEASLQVEGILKRIAGTDDMATVRIEYTDTFAYRLRFGKEPIIYLSELLKLANFNHIELSDEEVNLLGDKIEAVSNDFNGRPRATSSKLIARLPDAARRALCLYVGARPYKNINRLFRGVELTSEGQYEWIKPVYSRKSFIANFLAGCLVNWSAAELPRKLLYSDERKALEKVILNTQTSATPAAEVIKKMKADSGYYKQVLDHSLVANSITRDEYNTVEGLFAELDTWFPSYGWVDRAEDLEKSEKESGELGVKSRRCANPVFMPSVMSLSIFTGGAKYFQNLQLTRSKIETDNSTRPVINSDEGEILVPHGTSYLYTQNLKGGFFAREVNSPGIIPKGDYWSSIALAEAYRNYLSKPYQYAPKHKVTIEGVTIERPNHGLAHEYRVMLYIDIVIDYFAHYAKNDDFRLFCQCIDPVERSWLRVAAAYSVTGRENELSVGEDLAEYDKARNACKIQMASFLEKYPASSEDSAMREGMLDIVRWMGNPFYEKQDGDKPAINQLSDNEEREHRNFIYRILSLAHKLDLPRCYGPAQFNTALEMARVHVTQSDEQQADYLRMIRYAVDLIAAHGDCLRTDMEASGKLIDCQKQYRSPFQQVSSNLRQLREVSETISYPKLAEPYALEVRAVYS